MPIERDAFAPVRVEPVEEPDHRRLFRELVGRYHYLGYAVPYGAHAQYLVWISRPAPTVVGCLQFSSAAWRLGPRDRWIGWDEATRARQLGRVVTNSRLLVVGVHDAPRGAATPAARLAGAVSGDPAPGRDLRRPGALRWRLLPTTCGRFENCSPRQTSIVLRPETTVSVSK